MWSGFLLFSISILIVNAHEQLVRHTKNGAVRGRIWKTQKGTQFLGFTSIPFAKPPVGNLRFQAPIPAEPWNGVLDATKTHSPCSQTDYFAKNVTVIGKEDCLYLNVYTPLTGTNYPVMFYLYGGSFLIGSGADNWISPDILLDKNIVLVVLNYRLGSLGFLSTEDEVAPGNQGLKDQALALHWVKENIGFFGGDKSKITVFGNSAGGVSAHLLTMSPMTKDLVKGVIIQSGPTTTVYGFAKKGVPRNNTEQVALLSNCNASSSDKLLKCLQKIDVVELLNYERAISASGSLLSFFQPVIEIKHPGAFLSEDPVNIVISKKYANVPIMIGTTEQEGAYGTAEITVTPGLMQTLNDNFTEAAAGRFYITENIESRTHALRQFYFGNKTINLSTRPEITDMHSDGWFIANLDLTLHLLLKYKFPGQPVYLYLFGYRGSVSYTDLYGDLSYDYGVCHTDELLYLLPRPNHFPKYKLKGEEEKMADVLKSFWTNFATTGNPTPKSKLWQPLKSKKMEHLSIKSPTNLKMDVGIFSARRKFWRENIFNSVWNNIFKRSVDDLE